jgi:hypothetical protein
MNSDSKRKHDKFIFNTNLVMGRVLRALADLTQVSPQTIKRRINAAKVASQPTSPLGPKTLTSKQSGKSKLSSALFAFNQLSLDDKFTSPTISTPTLSPGLTKPNKLSLAEQQLDQVMKDKAVIEAKAAKRRAKRIVRYQRARARRTMSESSNSESSSPDSTDWSPLPHGGSSSDEEFGSIFTPYESMQLAIHMSNQTLDSLFEYAKLYPACYTQCNCRDLSGNVLNPYAKHLAPCCTRATRSFKILSARYESIVEHDLCLDYCFVENAGVLGLRPDFPFFREDVRSWIENCLNSPPYRSPSLALRA